MAWVGAGCAGSSPPTTIVCGTCEEPSRFVRLQTPPSSSSTSNDGGFSHPLRLSPENWRPLLASVRVQPVVSFFRRGEDQPAFTQEEIDYLSMPLSRAFAKASSEQWVVFGLNHPVPASGSDMTTGAWYVKGPMLHLLLPNFHAAVPMDNLREVLNRDPLFEVLEATRFEFVPTDYSVEDSEKPSLLSILKQETPHLAIEYQQLLAGGPSLKNVQGPEADDENVRPMDTETSDRSLSSLENRLGKLKGLKEKELITEEDYQRQKKELLDQL